MTETATALPARGHSWRLDALVGAAAALVALSAAHASLPETATPMARPAHVAAAPVVVTPEPVSLIAFSEPVPGRAINSPFGLRKLPWEEGGRLHEGVDIAAEPGEAVLAAADGVVTRAGSDGGYGRFVEVRHAEGLTTLYAHLGAIDAAAIPGAAVKSGVRIGAIGNSGSSTGPHLHFELRDARDRPLNPTLFLDRSFATADDLPLARAARIPRGVRIAYVSHIPQAKRELMEDREQAKLEAAEAKKAKAAGVVAFTAGERAHGRIDVVSAQFTPLQERKALVAKVAAAQHAEIAAEALQAATPASAIVPATPIAPLTITP
ncbi:MAG: M23 family metallopeptidase [Phenylobacterium sp.]|uniref:M23 family metallopeptidase n=1 Tax=Phenylobacterium sp. TaxID=1871053 RepID=UPI002734C61F|nr:M23 family metallopeptidase [Phenylobacterium sp.]MDP3174737.1 M23 family metallopeptidase [Phenylobacterium sp.]